MYLKQFFNNRIHVKWRSASRVVWTSLLVVGALSTSRPDVVHPVHTSITQMQFNETEKIFQVSIRLFTDDLEKALAKENNNQQIQIGVKDKADMLVERYLRKHFGLNNASKQRKPFNYLGKEQEADATWIYVEIPFTESIVGGALQNDVLIDVFDDQINLVNVSYLSQRKTLLFKSGQSVQGLGW